MRLHLRARKIRAHLVLIAERQEHHQFKFKSDRWQVGYMDSEDDAQPAKNFNEQEIKQRPVFRSRFEFRLILGNVCFEVTRFTPFVPIDGEVSHV